MPAELPPISRHDLVQIVDVLRQRLAALDADQKVAARLDLVRAAASLWQSTGFVAPFDWPTWIRERGMDWATDPAVVASAGLDTLRRLVTAHVRTNRFVEGHLEHLVASGYLARVVERLREISQEPAG